MENNCKDCVQIANLDKRVTKLEQQVERVVADIAEVDKNTKVSEEQIKMIFKILNEIKDSIKQIADKIDTIEQKPAKRWDDATKTAVTVAITAIVTFIMSKLFK